MSNSPGIQVSPQDNVNHGSPPIVFDIPTLGRRVRLGELYDAHSGRFLGIQLYPQDKIKRVETDIKRTDLTASFSTSHQQKTTLLDIDPRLSLDVLSGLVKVSGSASYLGDEKSNTHEYAYALALKIQLREERLLFAEDDLGHKVLPIVEEDYLNTKLATHFASTIVYGGNYIVNLVAGQMEMSREEMIGGEFQSLFDRLKGAISLSGPVDEKIKGEFKDMDNKFDLIVHGDVALDKVPVTPKDVLDAFPEAALRITDGRGVPMSVTLQPIPAGLYKAGLIYQIEDDLVDTVLETFAELRDLHSRFLVLQDSVKRLQSIVPKLAQAVHAATTEYIKRHSKLLHCLAEFLQDYKSGKKPNHVPLLADTSSLYGNHVQLDDAPKESSQVPTYPSTLVGLEGQLSRIQCLIADIRRVRESLDLPGSVNTKNPSGKEVVDLPSNHSFYLSSLESVCRSIRTQSETAIFIMPPISGNVKYFEDPVNIAHMVYAEDPEDVKRRFDSYQPSEGQELPELNIPSVVVAKVDKDGGLTWDHSPSGQPSAADAFTLVHDPSSGKFGCLMLGLDTVNSKKDFTFQIRAKEGKQSSETPYIIVLEDWDHKWLLAFKKGLEVKLQYNGLVMKSRVGKKPASDKEFLGAFVQDTKNQRWTLYLDGDEIASEPFTEKDLFPHGEKLRICYATDRTWWDGKLLEFKAFACALTGAEVKNLYLAWKNGQS